MLFAAALSCAIACDQTAPQVDATNGATASTNAKTDTTTGLGEKIAAIGGPITEIIFALGAGDRVALIDASSVYPPESQQLPRVDYFRKMSAEPILAHNPSAALIIEGAQPPAAVEQVASAVPVHRIAESATIDEAFERVETIAALLGKQEAGATLIAQMKADLDRAAAHREAATEKPKVLFIYARGPNTLLVAGQETSADTMLNLAGAENAAQGFTGFKPLTAEAVVAAAPEVFLMPDKGAESLGGWDGIAKLPGVQETPAFAAKRLVTVDDGALLGFGPRVGEALLEMQRELGIQGNATETPTP